MIRIDIIIPVLHDNVTAYSTLMLNYNFQRFTSTGSRFSCKASIRGNGCIGLSQAALMEAGILDDKWYAVLFYDADSRTIGIKPTRNGNESGAYKITFKEIPDEGKNKIISGYFSARSFLTYHKIPFGKELKQSFPLTFDESSGFLIFSLGEKTA
jgi:hypothetical protein